MSPAYPHLIVNHLPVAGALVASILLAVAVRRRTIEGAVYGYVALVVEAVLAIVTFVTGNFAPPARTSAPAATREPIRSRARTDYPAFRGSSQASESRWRQCWAR